MVDQNPKLRVELISLEESNGRITHVVYLAKEENEHPWDWYQVYSDSIRGRAEYEADKLKHFLGQGPYPNILDYETDE